MAKRKRKQNIEKMIKEGYGSGIGSEYKPWIKIQDVPSLGRVTRVKGIKTNRQHELLSDMERNYFYILEYSDNVKDIREQFPLLPQEDTISIADELGLRHPKDPETGEDIVMTTDFLITVSTEDGIKEVARTIKSKDDLLDKRILEKFEIERVFWKKRNIDWAIVTEEEIDKIIAHNISFIQGYRDIKNVDGFTNLDSLEIQDLVYEFIRRIVDDKRSVRAVSLEFDNDMSLESGCGLSIFKYLIINKIIKIDISKKIDVNKNDYYILKNSPERFMRDNLRSYLNEHMQARFQVEIELPVSKNKLDLYTEVDGRFYFIEIKWLGKSINSKGTDISCSYTDSRARNGIIQTLEYIRELKVNTDNNVKCGMLVVFDARKKKKKIDYKDYSFLSDKLNEYITYLRVFDKIHLSNLHPC